MALLILDTGNRPLSQEVNEKLFQLLGPKATLTTRAPEYEHVLAELIKPDAGPVLLNMRYEQGVPVFDSDSQAWAALQQGLSVFVAAATHLNQPFQVLYGTTKPISVS